MSPARIEFIAEVSRAQALASVPPPAVCSCGILQLKGEPSITLGPVTHGELCCYRVVREAAK